MIEIIIIAISLSTDAFAVTLSNALAFPKHKNLFFMPIYFGVFQCVMPIIGYYCANIFSDNIISLGNVIVFILLAFIGFKMVCDGFLPDKKKQENLLTHKILFLEGIATSIDAFGIGVSFCFMQTNIFFTSFLIGFITFAICFSGLYLFKKPPTHKTAKFEILGGFFLIFLAIKSLYF